MQMQTLLFEQGVQRIADAAAGPITYFPDVITPALAASWFNSLREQGDCGNRKTGPKSERTIDA